MLVRVAQWTLTDTWHPPAEICSKGGSPREHGSPMHITSHSRLMSYVFARTGDPLFLVVPRSRCWPASARPRRRSARGQPGWCSTTCPGCSPAAGRRQTAVGNVVGVAKPARGDYCRQGRGGEGAFYSAQYGPHGGRGLESVVPLAPGFPSDTGRCRRHSGSGPRVLPPGGTVALTMRFRPPSGSI